MRKIIIAIMAVALVVVSALGFASCSAKEVIREVEVPVETIVEVPVEKIVEVPVEVEKETAEINGMVVTGTYATQAKKGSVTVLVKYFDKVLNGAFDPTLDESETNPLYVAGEVVVTIPYTIDYTYTALLFGGATYAPALPGEAELVTLNGFYALNGEYLYATDATHAITAAGYIDTTVLPAEAVEQLTTNYEYVTFDFAD